MLFPVLDPVMSTNIHVGSTCESLMNYSVPVAEQQMQERQRSSTRQSPIFAYSGMTIL